MNAGRVVAWVFFVAGAAVSIAANVAHAEPVLGARLFGAVWPLFLVGSLEVLIRNTWPGGRRWAAAGTAVVAGVAAVLSYVHMAALLVRYGEGTSAAHVGPLAVDGLMVVCGAALLAGRTDEPAADERTDEVTVPSAPETPDRTEIPPTPSGPVTKPRPAKRTAKTVRMPRSWPIAPDLHATIREIHAEHGPGLNRDQLLVEIKAKGKSAGGDRKVAALAYYRSIRPLHAAEESA